MQRLFIIHLNECSCVRTSRRVKVNIPKFSTVRSYRVLWYARASISNLCFLSFERFENFLKRNTRILGFFGIGKFGNSKVFRDWKIGYFGKVWEFEIGELTKIFQFYRLKTWGRSNIWKLESWKFQNWKIGYFESLKVLWLWKYSQF